MRRADSSALLICLKSANATKTHKGTNDSCLARLCGESFSSARVIMRRVLFSSLLLALCVCSAFAQKTKPWTELSEKEAAKILNDSPWGQTQTEGEESHPQQTSAITQVAAPRSADRQLSREGEAPEIKPAGVVKYRTRFLSAKPVRAAFA